MNRMASLTMRVCVTFALAFLLSAHAQQQLPLLDLDSLEAETAEGTLHAQRAENSFVGEVEEGRIIGIAFRSDIGGPPDAGEQREIVVHLYDRQEPALLMGQLDEQGAATLQTDEGGYFDASVDLVMGDDEVTGTVTYRDEDPIPFTAPAATDQGGVYWALGDEDWEIQAADWVVLPDGRQWGAVCMPMEPWLYWCFMRN
jgi:hypothetical protein